MKRDNQVHQFLVEQAERCHPACVPGCAECFRARSEAVGAEYEMPMFAATRLSSFAVACALVVACVALALILSGAIK